MFVCAGCHLGMERSPDRRGTPVQESEVPEAVLREFKRRNSEPPRSIERTEGGLYRFESESGSIFQIDQWGITHGMII
jgi:hypothetical protein